MDQLLLDDHQQWLEWPRRQFGTRGRDGPDEAGDGAEFVALERREATQAERVQGAPTGRRGEN